MTTAIACTVGPPLPHLGIYVTPPVPLPMPPPPPPPPHHSAVEEAADDSVYGFGAEWLLALDCRTADWRFGTGRNATNNYVISVLKSWCLGQPSLRLVGEPVWRNTASYLVLIRVSSTTAKLIGMHHSCIYLTKWLYEYRFLLNTFILIENLIHKNAYACHPYNKNIYISWV